MAYLTLPRHADGLVVSVMIGFRRARLQALRAAGQPLPNPVQLRGVIDTGADVTSVSDAALAPLGLVPVGPVLVNTPGGHAIVNRYNVSLTIVDPAGAPSPGIVFPNLTVLGLNAAPIGFDVLIGLDVLAHCLLLADGRRGVFTLAF